ncbi:hypothetical protein G7Z17_g11798 [Cylindrodendrum hubeiense]|uniref:Uncharacterized protein n=1 Tax=Cylindrodendrum hubeiense TaxID=595255 RepID=A0A9P5L3M8_9HYPO|nr:hypothetical protein G7Z17_g11798 [Cylindrodendrum hubeiense]
MSQRRHSYSESDSRDHPLRSHWSSSPDYSENSSSAGSFLLEDHQADTRLLQPAFAKARVSQEILVKIQTSLRRMPGVSSKESNEIISQLQEVGQIISQETSQLVDALMNLTLDQEDTDKAIARMSIEANLTKAEADDQAQTIGNLRVELSSERDKRKDAEAEVGKVMEDLQNLTRDFKSYKEKDVKSEGGKSPSREEMIKHLEDTISHLEGQVNNRRSLWVMKHPSAESVARAIETIADSCQDKEVVHKSIMSLRPDSRDEPEPRESKNLSHVFTDMATQPPRPPTGFQPNRPGTYAPPRFGPLASGPPRAASTLPSDRRHPANWAPPTPAQSRFGNHPGNGTGPVGGFGRAPSRRGFQHNGAYRTNVPDHFSQHMPSTEKSFNRPESAFGHRREYYPTTPSATRGKYGRFRDNISPDYGNTQSTALAGRNAFPGPLIHITEMTVAAWNEQVMELYTVIRTFVENNANEPSYALPSELSHTRLWPVLLATYYPLSETEAVSYLEFHLKDESSKSCLVTRVLVDFIVNRVWVPRAWCGADTEATYGIMDIEKDLERTQGQPSSHRQPILDRQAGVIDSILKLDHYTQFSKMRIEEITDMILNMIQPLLNEAATPAGTYRDLELVSGTAWALSSRILSSRLTFDFRFPEVGCRFSCQSMIPIWPNMDPMELQAKHWRVALVTTPVITCRNDTGANISAHSVALADVVCMQ